MNRPGSSVSAFVLCIVLTMSLPAESGENQEVQPTSDATVAITHLRVDDQSLELSWTIENRSDHDVWILESMHLFEPSFEVFLAQDNETLIIRRRLDVPAFAVWFATPEGRYVRLRRGERHGSFSLEIPVVESSLFPGGEGSTATFAEVKRVILEIGYYDEDLPELIRGILTEAGKLNPEISSDNQGILGRYFRGLSIHFAFGGLSAFEASYTEGSREIWVPYTYRAFEGERVLRATVDGVSIPYGTEPAGDEPPQILEDAAEVKIMLTGLDVTDASLGVNCKIKNDTDHDVWICNSLSQDPSAFVFEHYMDGDAKTLLIRRRFDLPMSEGTLIERAGGRSRYVRLRPGQEKPEFFSLALPVWPYRILSGESGSALNAERLALEIGFYDQDLPALILEIVEIAEHLNIDFSVGYYGFSEDVSSRFFGGPRIALLFNANLGFDPSVRSADSDGEMWMPNMDETHMGEEVLRIEVDGVTIPYESR